MLRFNPLQPPRPFLAADRPSPTATTGERFGHEGLLSAEDYDLTGILTGVDPCESQYWWMPELHAEPPFVAVAGSRQATRRPTAAA